MLASSSVFSQLDGIVVEKYYQARSQDLTIANENKATGSPDLTTSFVTYRVYVDVAAGFRLSAVYGDANHPATFATTTSFYNYTGDLGGKEIWPTASTAATVGKALGLDSYFTMGQVADGQAGIIESEDGNTQLISTGTGSGLLLNNPGGTCFGAPLFGTGGIDGFTPGVVGTSIGEVSSAGLAGLTGALGMVGGGTITFSNGSFASQTGIVGPAATTSNKVLIGQFTTDGVFTFSFNVQILPVGGTTQYKYVYSNATGSEINNATLTLAPNAAPAVSITSVTQPTGTNTNILTGTVMTFNATASDNVSVSQVEFFVDGVSVGVDNSSPYSATYTAVAGVGRVVTAVATDNVCVTTTSAGSTFTVANNAAPTVTVSAPASVIASSTNNLAAVTFTASPVDNDGVSSISQVEFFVGTTSVGTVTTAPWTVNYNASIGNGQLVKAVVTDNLGLTGTSTNASMSVLGNNLPTVSITSPLASAALAAPNAITFTATAGDTDGTITQVEFFVGTGSIGVATTSPYSVTWPTSTPGTKNVTAKATDSNGGITTSAVLTIDISDPSALPYKVKAVSQVCNTTTFLVPIATGIYNGSNYVVDNVRGYDLVINYDANDVTPTDVVIPGALTTAPVEYSAAHSANGSVGTLNVSLYFQGSAPVNSEFAGMGDVLSVVFTRIGGFAPLDSSAVSVASLQESYVTTAVTKLVTPNKMYSTTEENYNGTLQYWNGTAPIAYNPASSSSFLITNIKGVFGTGLETAVPAVTPNTSGVFTHVLNTMVNGNRTYVPNIAIKRDIINTADITSQSLFSELVGATDAGMGKTILLNQPLATGTPSVYQMIALDVNMDGKVTAGDISQIQQRTVGALQEFQQAWNYDINGVAIPGAGPSKDWLFVDQATVANDANYQISSTYPSGNTETGGYWKGRVPVVPFYLPVNVTGYSANQTTCPVVAANTVYKGIMLGEVSGNYAAIGANGITKANETDYILVDLSNAIVEGTKVSVPVSIVSEEPVTAFDLALGVNENTLTYVSMEDVQLGSESASFFNDENKTLRHSSFNLNTFTSNSRVAYFTFETIDGKISEKDLTAELGLLNEKQAEVRFTKSADLTNNSVDIYPNPSNGMFTVMSKVDGRVDIVDVTGKLVHPGVIVKANQMIEVNMPELSAGVYFVRLYSNNSMTTERIVIGE